VLPEKPAWLAWLGSDVAWFRQFLITPSKQALMSNLKLDVILLVYKCDLTCLNL
jgi:hypothetical protein